MVSETKSCDRLAFVVIPLFLWYNGVLPSGSNGDAKILSTGWLHDGPGISSFKSLLAQDSVIAEMFTIPDCRKGIAFGNPGEEEVAKAIISLSDSLSRDEKRSIPGLEQCIRLVREKLVGEIKKAESDGGYNWLQCHKAKEYFEMYKTNIRDRDVHDVAFQHRVGDIGYDLDIAKKLYDIREELYGVDVVKNGKFVGKDSNVWKVVQSATCSPGGLCQVSSSAPVGFAFPERTVPSEFRDISSRSGGEGSIAAAYFKYLMVFQLHPETDATVDVGKFTIEVKTGDEQWSEHTRCWKL